MSRSARLIHALPPILLTALIGASALAMGGLALWRHWNLDSQALDMGYASQVTWNALQGRGLRFTVFRGEVGSELGRPLQFGPGADRDSLLAYHVELLYFPLSQLYRIYAGPEILIVLLAGVLALGALPAYWIACRQTGHRGAALAFAAMYLLFPSIQAAALSDFHAVSLTGSLLLFAWHFLLAGRYLPFGIAAVAGTLAKEEVGLLVGMMGLYVWLRQGRRWLGLAVAALAFAWVALCFGVIMPRANGGAPSLFSGRYSDALDLLRDFARAAAAGRLVSPVADYAVAYVGHLLASTGWLALLAPLELAMAAPVLALNSLSDSPWQHGGGAHYSAEVVPALLVAAICGARRLAAWGHRWFAWPRGSATLGIALAGLAIALGESWREGILPPAQRFTWPAGPPRVAHLRPLLERIPPDAPVSAQSNVFPHLATREQIYVFPAVEDAAYVLIDVAGTSDPLAPDRLYPAATALLASGRFEVLDAVNGLLLLARRRDDPHRLDGRDAAGGRDVVNTVNPVDTADSRAVLRDSATDARRSSSAAGSSAGGSGPAPLPPAFYSFARADENERFTPISPAPATFGDRFEVLGYRWERLPEVNFPVRRVRPVLYVRSKQTTNFSYRFAAFLIGGDNVVREVEGGNATQFWYPTSRWVPGEVVRLSYPPLAYRAGDRIGVGVTLGDAADAPRLPVRSQGAQLLDDGHVLVLGRLP
jgi:uncharacterized membrane protein